MRVRTYYVKCQTAACDGEILLAVNPKTAFLTPLSAVTLRCGKCQNAYEYRKSDLWNRMPEQTKEEREG
jgi:hypothetical protein